MEHPVPSIQSAQPILLLSDADKSKVTCYAALYNT